MIKWILSSVAVLTALFLFTAPGKSYRAQIFYYPMLSLTHPISEKSIEEMYDLTSVAQEEWRNITTILADASDEPKRPFSSSRVRLKVVDPDGKVYLCDLYGNVLIDGKTRKLSEQDHKKVRRIILESMPTS